MYQMVGVAEPQGGIGLVLTYRAELIDYLPEGSETLFEVLPAALQQVQVLELPSLAVCRATVEWVEEKFDWEPAAPMELVGSDTLS